MSLEAARKLVEKLDVKVNELTLGSPFLRPDYKTGPLDASNFHAIPPASNEGKIAFVDGGNREILRAPNFSVQINRVYYNVFRGRRREVPGSLPLRIEFFSLTYSAFKGGRLYFETSIFPLREEFHDYLPDETDLRFSSADRSLSIGFERADISRAASLARRFAEWEFAYHVAREELDSGDILVVDGTLQTPHVNEAKYAEKIQRESLRKEVHFTGLSKTCELHTTTGLSLIGAIRKLAEDNGISGAWYYPLATISSSDHKAIVFITKLHPRAERIFRFEMFAEDPSLDDPRADEVLSRLSVNASDISMPGYPYGLLDADAFARIREEEAERYRIMLLSEISKQGKWKKFVRHIRATDAHEFLNMLVG